MGERADEALMNKMKMRQMVFHACFLANNQIHQNATAAFQRHIFHNFVSVVDLPQLKIALKVTIIKIIIIP